MVPVRKVDKAKVPKVDKAKVVMAPIVFEEPPVKIKAKRKRKVVEVVGPPFCNI